MRNAKTLFVVLCIMLTHLGTAHAKLGAFEFEHMVKGATFIVIGKVKSVSLRKNATVEVLEILKGAPGQELVLNVGKTWTCDVSEAKKGETILLFVSRNQKEKRNQIYASGRGRMPIDELKGKKYATFCPEVRMPKGIEVIKGPEPKWSFIRRANLGDLKKCIKKTLEESGRNLCLWRSLRWLLEESRWNLCLWRSLRRLLEESERNLCCGELV